MDKRKQGIALFITLMVIASIMSILAVSFTYLDKAKKDAGITSALIQGNLLYKNTSMVLKRFFPEGANNTEKLKLIYTLPLMLTEPKSGFTISISCKPLMVAVPINWLNEGFTKKIPERNSLAEDTLMSVMDLYDIREPNELKNMIVKSIINRDEENSDYRPRVKKRRGVFSYKQFERLIMNYRLTFDDPNVLKVPWEKYFSYTTVNEDTKIDGVFLTPEFISIAFDIPIEIVKDSWKMGETTLKNFFNENSIVVTLNKKMYAEKSVNAMHCEESYVYKEQYYKFNFDYIEGRSGNFEFNGEEQ